MDEPRAIAMAGLFQACGLVHDVATRGEADAAALETSLASVFRIDAESVDAVFGGVANLRYGLRTTIAMLGGERREPAVTRLVLAVLSLERRFGRQPGMRERVRAGIEALAADGAMPDVSASEIQARMAELYRETLSQLPPRITVHGDPALLARPRNVDRIRALLLAAVRAAVLWRQLGGSQWRLLLRRRAYLMLARGLLTRGTLDRG
jgi:high frequency lysogenization protein